MPQYGSHVKRRMDLNHFGVFLLIGFPSVLSLLYNFYRGGFLWAQNEIVFNILA